MTINEKLAALLVEHPTAKLVPMIDSELMLDAEEVNWVLGEIEDVKIDNMCEWEEHIFLQNEDQEEMDLVCTEKAINELAAKDMDIRTHPDECIQLLNQYRSEMVWEPVIVLIIQ